jgi:hypothetical protein
MTPPAIGMDQISADAAFNRVTALVNRLFAIIFVGLVVFAIAGLGLRYSEVSSEGRRSTENLAEVLSEYLVIRMGAVDGMLSKIIAGSRRIGGPEGPDRDWTSILRGATTGVPGVSSIVILDADGNIAHATIPQIAGLSWADRPVFQRLATGHANQLAVDLPFEMMVGDQVLVPIGRALTDPRGEFIGTAIATLVPNQLEEFYQTFDLGRDGVAWVLLPGGEVLFRHGFGDDTTSRTPPLFISGKQIAEDGFVSGPIEPGGSNYLTAYRQTGIGGVVTAVSLAERDLLVGLWYDAAGVAAFIVIAGIFLLFAARRINSAVLGAMETASAADNTAPPL